MRKTLSSHKIQILESVLKDLGYRRLGHPLGFYGKDWKKGRFHVILRGKPNRIDIHIHYDRPHHIGPARTKGKDLEEELKNMMKGYKRKAGKLI